MSYKSEQRVPKSRNKNGLKISQKVLTSFLAIRKMQIKTNLRFQLTPVKIAETNKTRGNKCWQGCGERKNVIMKFAGQFKELDKCYTE